MHRINVIYVPGVRAPGLLGGIYESDEGGEVFIRQYLLEVPASRFEYESYTMPDCEYLT